MCIVSIINQITHDIVAIVKAIVTNQRHNKKKQQQEIFLLFLEQVLPVNALGILGGARVAYGFMRGDIRGGLEGFFKMLVVEV